MTDPDREKRHGGAPGAIAASSLRHWAVLGFGTIAAVTAGLWIVLVYWDERQMYRTVEAKVEYARTFLNEGIVERVQALKRMSVRWDTVGGTPRHMWEADAAQYIGHIPDIQALGWVDPAGRVRWAFPRAGNERALGLDLNAEPSRLALEQVRTERDVVVSGLVPLAQGGRGILVSIPLFVRDRFDGCLLAVIRLDRMFEQIFKHVDTEGYVLTVFEDDETVYQRGRHDQPAPALGVFVALSLGNSDWRLRLQPTAAHLAAERSSLPWLVVVVGAGAALVFGLLLRFWGTSLAREAETRRTNAALAVSEAKLKEAQHLARLGYWALDVPSGKMEWSSEVYGIFGRDPATFRPDLDTYYRELVHPEDVESVHCEEAAAYREPGRPHYVDHRTVLPNGTHGWVHIEGVATLDVAGNPTTIRGTVQDITDRKLAEQALRRQHALLAAISRAQSGFIRHTDERNVFGDLLADLLVLTDSKFGFIGEVLFKEDRAPYLKTRAITDVVWDGPAPRAPDGERAAPGMEFVNPKSLYGAALTSGKPVIVNDPGRDPRRCGLPAGHPPLNAFLGVPLFLGEEMVGMIGIANRPGGYDEGVVEFLNPLCATIARIIGEIRSEAQRQAAERALHAAAARMHAILDNAVDGVIAIDERGIVESFNPAATRIFGYAAGEVVGRSVYMLMPEPHRSRHDQYLTRYLGGGTVRNAGIRREVEGQRKDGSLFPLDLAVSELRIEGRHLFIGMMHDITERKKVERLKNEFVSTVSHELRTPLTSIRGALGLLAGGTAGELPDKARQLVEIAHGNSNRLTRLVNDILDAEKIESGKMRFDLAPHPILPLVEQALDAIRGYAATHGVELALAPGAPAVNVHVDDDRLLQVLANLLSNAIKFSPANATVDVAVSLRAGGRVRVSVADRGPGVPAGFHDRIFEKFSQADVSDARARGGSGLGLNISKTFVERMNGDTGFEPRPGGGTLFYVDLLEQSPVSSPGAARVLVCEDDPDVAYLLILILEQGGFAADVACNAEQAKQLLSERSYAAMTLDLKLPGQDGVSLIRELRADSRYWYLPIVVVSGDVAAGQAQINGGFAVEDWLSKPIDGWRLLNAVERAVHGPNGQHARVLHVEDDPDIRRLVASLCQDVAEYDYAASAREAREKLACGRYRLVILDLALPDGSGEFLLADIKAHEHPPGVLVFSAGELPAEQAHLVQASLVKSRATDDEFVNLLRMLVQRDA